MNFRKKIFWLVDLLKGRKVYPHFKDIEFLLNNPSLEKSIKTKEKYLSNLLRFSVSSVPYYSNYSNFESINDFPVIDKNIIRENAEAFLSKAVSAKDRIGLITSGSTGTPFKIFQDKNKRYRSSADTIFFGRLAGFELGNKLFYLKIWSEYNRKNPMLKWMQNIVSIDVLNLTEKCPLVIESINSNNNPISFLGYTSAFETLCKYLDGNNPLYKKAKVNSIITMSESLDDYTKYASQKYFSCPILSRYSNIENGILAQQTLSNQNDFTINTASFLVEIMDMFEDTVLPEGQLGRIIVTDYFNKAMPMIRYDTGDLGILETRKINDVDTLVLSRIEGRKLDQIYNTKGCLISSYIVYKNMWKYTEIEQYQFIQVSKTDYNFKICIKGEFARANELIKEFKEYLGDDANFQIHYVHEIPLLNSGKRKKVVNEMKIF